MEPWVDSAVVLETSCGALVVDCFGKDAPNGVSWIVDLCTSQIMHSAIASATRYGGSLLRFELAVGAACTTSPPGAGTAAAAIEKQCPWMATGTMGAASQHSSSAALASPLEAADARLQSIGMFGKKRNGDFQQTGVRLRFSGRPGLVLLPKNMAVETSERAVLHASGVPVVGPLAFFVTTTAQNFDFLESTFVAVGQVSEGLPTLNRMRTSHCGAAGAAASLNSSAAAAAAKPPLRLVRIKHATLLTPPVAAGLSARARALNHDVGSILIAAPAHEAPYVLVNTATNSSSSSSSTPFVFRYNAQCHDGFLSSDDDGSGAMSSDVRKEVHRRKLDETRQMMMHVMDGITDANITPPETVLFVCKLNPMTTSDGLKTCFSQFGRVVSADVIRDAKGNSRCYAFVEFADQTSCDRAFQRMDQALIDDSRIHVDFSQSVSKIWNESRRTQKSSSMGGKQQTAQQQTSRVRGRDE